jgi:hypothetical protein
LPAVFLQSVFSLGDPAVSTKISPDPLPTQNLTDALKSWVMVVLTLGFVVLYGLALIGRLKPLADASMVSRIEPIIFVIIGYYFGRLPGQQNESTLKGEIGRQTQRADAAQHAKEQALQTREAVEERLKNVDAALTAPSVFTGTNASIKTTSRTDVEDAVEKRNFAAALNILRS